MANRLRYITIISIVLLLVFTYRLYAFAYFWTDDFSNLYWVQRQSAPQMLWYLVNPWSRFFRPGGMIFYWLMLHFFGLNALPYHVLAWLLHAANTALVYVILKRMTQSEPGSAIGAMLFASEAAFADIYWSFGTIFELVCAAAMFTGILLWNTNDRSWPRSILCLLVFVFAFKAKEMAVTLPAIFLLCDLLIHRIDIWKTLRQLIPLAVFGAGYGLTRASEMESIQPSNPYYMDLRWVTLGRGYGAYWNQLFHTNLRWQLWAVAFAALLLALIVRRSSTAIFFQAYLFVSFLPLVFLVNHRYPFYWYIPMLGVCGLAALAVKSILLWFPGMTPGRSTGAAAAAAFVGLCALTYIVQRNKSLERRAMQQQIAAEYREFAASLQARPQPPPNGTVYFEELPSYFDRQTLLCAAQVVLRRTDIDVGIR